MKKIFIPVALIVFLSGCTFTTDEQYIRCLQGFNDSGSGGGIPGGKAATVIAAGAVGAAAALVLCEEPEVTESPQVLEADIGGDLSQPLEVREPLLVSKSPTVSEPMRLTLDEQILPFELDSAELPLGAGQTLLPVVDYLKEFPEVSVTVAGHTCWLGTEAHNEELSEKRAKAVADFMVQQGVEADRLVVEAYGESRPVATNQTDDGRRRNRRVEVIQR